MMADDHAAYSSIGIAFRIPARCCGTFRRLRDIFGEHEVAMLWLPSLVG
jgi:hypothetical protein